MTDEPGFEALFAKRVPEADTPPPASKPKAAPRPPADKPLDGNITAAELRKQLTNAFNAPGIVMGLPAVESAEFTADQGRLKFTESEFAEASEALVALFGQHAQLRILIRIIGPLAAVSILFERVQRIVRAWKEKKLREQQRKEAERNGTAAPIPPTNNEVKPVGKRPLFK